MGAEECRDCHPTDIYDGINATIFFLANLLRLNLQSKWLVGAAMCGKRQGPASTHCLGNV